ncbi:hypothetical protein B0H10DRAFT_2435567, partial [Mycena sp. CBHHK59/15]
GRWALYVHRLVGVGGLVSANPLALCADAPPPPPVPLPPSRPAAPRCISRPFPAPYIPPPPTSPLPYPPAPRPAEGPPAYTLQSQVRLSPARCFDDEQQTTAPLY